jgi:hypothetical protein
LSGRIGSEEGHEEVITVPTYDYQGKVKDAKDVRLKIHQLIGHRLLRAISMSLCHTISSSLAS